MTFDPLRQFGGLINPRRACEARVTVVVLCVFVCLSVCDYSRTTGYEAAYEKIYGHGVFAVTTAFERYGLKSSKKANMHNEHWLTSTRFSPFSAQWTN